MKTSYNYLNGLGWILAAFTSFLGMLGIMSLSSANGLSFQYIGLCGLFFYIFLEVGKRILFVDVAKAIAANKQNLSIMLALFTILITALLAFLSFEGAKMAFYSSDIYNTLSHEKTLLLESDSLTKSIDNSIQHLNNEIAIYQGKQNAYLSKTGHTITKHHQSDIEALRAEKMRLYDEKESIRQDYQNQIKALHSSRSKAGGKLAYISIILEALLIAILAYLAYYRYQCTQLATTPAPVVKATTEAIPAAVPPPMPAVTNSIRHQQKTKAVPLLQMKTSTPADTMTPIPAATTTSKKKPPPAQTGVITLRRAKSELSKYKGRKQTETVQARILYYEYIIQSMLEQQTKEMKKPIFTLSDWIE